MSTLLLSGFLPLLLLAWLPAGFPHQPTVSSLTINVSELSFQSLFQMVSNSTDKMVKQFIDQIKNVTEKKVEKVVIHFLYEKNSSAFGSVNETKTATCICDMRNASRVEDGTNKTQQGIIHTYIIPGLVVLSLFFLICVLVCLCRRNQRNAKGKSESKHVAEMNQLSTPQNEEVVYMKLKFEKTETKPAASEVVYAEIKSQQK
ncbi:uncharacterized protein LOC118246466 isoform X2 [Cygnus atratus]|uniref:uncharacterized protein LOC118246466 isoform X2 n=1 Tax=Cygnus atratus TaxID=8868 RepID=UPI0015D58386|nr:uncharacterized protein LOC118246466 isoform X2 [Cygnus atratus]